MILAADDAATRIDLSRVSSTRLRTDLRTATPDPKMNLLSCLRHLVLLRCSDPSRRWLQHSAGWHAVRELWLNCASFGIGCLLVLHAEAATDLAYLLCWTVFEYFGLLQVVLSQYMLHDDRLDLAVAGLGCVLLGFHFHSCNNNERRFVEV